MSFEERASSWALSLVDALESQADWKVRVVAVAGGALVTITMWVVHLSYPDIFTSFLEMDGWAKLFLGFVLAPPFVVAFSVGSFIYRVPTEPEKTDEFGPMSAYFYQENASRRWKILIVAAIIGAVNFLLMLVTSGI